MARYITSLPIDRIHGLLHTPGSRGGIVCTDGPTIGNSARSHSTIVKPASAAQTVIRSKIAASSKLFATLDQATAQAWNDLAWQITRTNALGYTYRLTGIGVFNQVNLFRQLDGQALTTSPPPFAAIPPPITALTSCSVAFSLLDFTLLAPGVVNNCLCCVRTTNSSPSQARKRTRSELRWPNQNPHFCFQTTISNTILFHIALNNVSVTAGEFIGAEFRLMSAGYLVRTPWFIRIQLVS